MQLYQSECHYHRYGMFQILMNILYFILISNITQCLNYNSGVSLYFRYTGMFLLPMPPLWVYMCGGGEWV